MKFKSIEEKLSKWRIKVGRYMWKEWKCDFI